VAVGAHEIAFFDLGHDVGYCSRGQSADVEQFRRRVAVIELHYIRRVAIPAIRARLVFQRVHLIAPVLPSAPRRCLPHFHVALGI
jgi:hypothetical protein